MRKIDHLESLKIGMAKKATAQMDVKIVKSPSRQGRTKSDAKAASGVVLARIEGTGRPRGRPPKNATPIGNEAALTREAIIEKAISLSKIVPLADISMVQLAREFDVAPGLIHYYVGNRDYLISGVLNSYYRGRLQRLPKLTGSWRVDIEKMARVIVKYSSEYPGVAQYIASHNRFRLFQQVDEGETDYGVVVFDYVARAFLQGGFTPEQASLAFHLLMQYLVASSMSLVSRQLPADHEKFIREKFDALSMDQYPAARTVGVKFASLNFSQAFEGGLALLLDGFEKWLNDK